jgi:hypothetical protein
VTQTPMGAIPCVGSTPSARWTLRS